jgi:hypothetical protein
LASRKYDLADALRENGTCGQGRRDWRRNLRERNKTEAAGRIAARPSIFY